MKKLLSILLVLLMVFACFSLAACGDDKKTSNSALINNLNKNDDNDDDTNADGDSDNSAAVDSEPDSDTDSDSDSAADIINCESCHSADSTIKTGDNFHLCDDCHNEYTIICDGCYNSVYAYHYNDGCYYCYDCFYDSLPDTSGECDNCNDYADELYTTYDGYDLCKDCSSNSQICGHCYHCGNSFFSYGYDNDNNIICGDCSEYYDWS